MLVSRPEPFDVVVVGNVGIDTNVYLHGDEIDFSVEGNFTENLDCVGQAGGYSSRGYMRLGRESAFIGHVGDDAGGRWIREIFSGDGIDTRALFTDPAGTARSVNLVGRDGSRKNFYDGKGHMGLRPDLSVCRGILAGAGLAHFHLPNWARALLPVARELGVPVACDLQDIVDLHDPYRREFIHHADILFFSAVNHPDPTVLIPTILGIRPGAVVVAGMASRGCALGTEVGIRFFPALDMGGPVVDSNGAGDGLAVGFLTSYLLDGYGLEDSILRGQIAARHACTLRGDTSSLITADELDRRFKTLRSKSPPSP